MSFRPFQLRSGEELRPGLVRIVTRIAAKSATLPGFRAGRAEHAIHEARLLIKLLRALVWMARPALGRDTCRRIRLHLRAAARCLAGPRDAAILVSTLSKLARKISGHRRRAGFALAAEVLARDFAAPGDASMRRKLAAAGRHLERVHLLFRRGAETTARPWPSVARRNRQAAHSCRKAMKRALASGQAGDFHEWRKKAKRLLYQLRVTEPAPDASLRKTVALVDKLQAKLGDHHDLVVLEGHFRKDHLFSRGPDPARSVLQHLRRQKTALEKRLKPLGKRCGRAGAERLKT